MHCCATQILLGRIQRKKIDFFYKTRVVVINLKARYFLTFSISNFHCIYVIYDIYGAVGVKRGQKNEVLGHFLEIRVAI